VGRKRGVGRKKKERISLGRQRTADGSGTTDEIKEDS